MFLCKWKGRIWLSVEVFVAYLVKETEIEYICMSSASGPSLGGELKRAYSYRLL